MRERVEHSRAIRFLGVVTTLYLVGIFIGVLASLNMARLAEIHLDRGVPLTGWARLQIEVGHFFIRKGMFVFVVSTFAVAALWLRFLLKNFFIRTTFDEGHD